jgi:hypothetical protein
VSLTIFTRDLEHAQPLSRTRRFGPGVVRLSRRQASKSDLKLGLPGMWFIESEADALVAMQHLMSSLDRRLIGPLIALLNARLDMIPWFRRGAGAEACKHTAAIFRQS